MITDAALRHKKNWYYLSLIYVAFHVISYFLLQTRDVEYHYVHSFLDDKIPFVEFFIIPYVLWFAYMAGGILFFVLTSKKEFIRLSMFTFVGLGICIMICFFYPTAIAFRPQSFERDNFLIRLTLWIYSTDKPVNAWPSMHCYGSLGINFAMLHSNFFKRKAFLNVSIKVLSTVMALSICASTVLIKQHSILDFFAAVVLCAILYPLVYIVKWPFLKEKPELGRTQETL